MTGRPVTAADCAEEGRGVGGGTEERASWESADRGRRWLWPVTVAVVLGAVYGLTLLPGPGYSPDTAEMQFSGRLLCVTHPTGYPAYLLLNHAFSRIVPAGSVAFRANLFSALCSVLACLVLRRLTLRLGAREAVAATTAVAFGLTPTFWRLSIVAEVYSLHALFLALVALGLLRWRQTGKRRDLIVTCGLLAASFGNHLTTVTVLPAVVFLVLATRWRVLLDAKVAAPVATLIVVGVLQYAYPLLRSVDPSTPYLAVPIRSLADLWMYMTGASFHGAMFAFAPSHLLVERTPLFARHWWADCGILLPLAVAGVGGFKDRGARLFLGPRVASRVPAAACFALPLALGVAHWRGVETAKGQDQAQPMRELLEEAREGAVIVARYNDYMYLLYFTLAERLGGPSVYVGNDVSVEAHVAYLEKDQPIRLAPLRKSAPPGLPVLCTQLSLKPALRAAGLRVKTVRPGVFRIEGG